ECNQRGSNWRAGWRVWTLSHRSAEEGVDLNHNSFHRIELAKDCVGAGFLGEFEQIYVVEVGSAGNSDDSGFCVPFPKAADHFSPADVGHAHIGNDQIRAPILI